MDERTTHVVEKNALGPVELQHADGSPSRQRAMYTLSVPKQKQPFVEILCRASI